ncbi:MAG: hypothetical protein OXL96_13150 [Candidatus Poribacteria bacterium]|nr:hypothetical protein [Candidatus Poribacteria bacterium]
MESIIIEKLKLLPPECHKEVIHFIDTLLTEKVSQQKRNPNWIGLVLWKSIVGSIQHLNFKRKHWNGGISVSCRYQYLS